MALLFSTVASLSYANIPIKIEGLDDTSDITDYLQEAIVLKYQDSESLHKSSVEKLSIRQDTLEALHAKGFYDSHVSVKQNEDTLILSIHKGSAYKIGTIEIEGYTLSKEINKSFNLKAGDVLDAFSVIQAQQNLIQKIKEQECFYTLSIHHEVQLDHLLKKGYIKFIVQTGPSALFGQTHFQGAETIDRSYLQRLIRYTPDTCWKTDKLEATKTALLETGLLSLVHETIPDIPSKEGYVDILFELKSRPPRSVRLGTRYNTDEGVGFTGRWIHKNFQGSAEKLSVDLNTTLLKQSLGFDFSKPHFLLPHQSLSLLSSLEREDTDAFEELSFNSGASLKRNFTNSLSGHLGVTAEITKITDEDAQDEKKTFGLVSIPSALNFDNRDKALDPHKGWFIHSGLEPFADVLGESSPFLKSTLTASTYFDLGQSSIDPVLALKGSFGSIIGDATESIPISKRFFSGGGNSIRGFGFQEVGPFEDGDPSGGRSRIESSAEIRFKATDTIGGVAFIDGGNVFDSPFPDFKGGYFWGAGAGVRYYTDFAPIRFDVAVPLNKRDNIDQNFQIYISIGQAF